MNNNTSDKIFAALLAKLTVGRDDRVIELYKNLDSLPSEEQDRIIRDITRFGPDTDLGSLYTPTTSNIPTGLLTANEILTTKWPEPVWAIPGILPVGLGILAGAPKVGKSWLALQIAQSVAAGGYCLGERVDRGSVLYMALEDPARRLKERMLKQKWPLGLRADFITVGNFNDQIGDLNYGGGERLAMMIESQGYRLVVIDTFSRSIKGDQSDVGEMTTSLTPIQEMAHAHNCVVILVDHHKKRGGFDDDVIADILGSTAKAAMADTVFGLYRERHKSGARLQITGREVEEKILNLHWDYLSGCWQLDMSGGGLTENQDEILEVLEQMRPAGPTELGKAVSRSKGAVYNTLRQLEEKGKTYQTKNGKWDLVSMMESYTVSGETEE